ncbi:cell division protein ZapE [Lysinibacter cavernae]|uniref:Cell division protein ZapE n=1 Tax=Lysinibacter cavernae TaxID=1640652 RepID=A0A7X5R0T7_9MICO|nr:cell division protein ZapE [Lysinibacter cavernae]NIH53501.1 cell division protein ZapE [Lysinibacter cavernae]
MTSLSSLSSPRAHQPVAESSAVLADRVGEAATAAGFALDHSQLGVLDLLADESTGVYLWGPSGRGKTWLLDQYFALVPGEQKRRIHFHGFFARFHASIFQHRIDPNRGERHPVDAAIDELLGDATLVVFDEFHVHDAGDATLLIGVLDELFRRGIRLVVSSNYAPAELMPNPNYHHLFAPGIQLLETRLSVFEMTGDTDYRRAPVRGERTGFARGTWGTTQVEVRGANGDVHTPPDADEEVALESAGHRFTARRAGNGLVWFDFASLLDSPTSVNDYLRWAERFSTWVLGDVPSAEHLSPGSYQRLVNLIDVLCDAQIEVHVRCADDRSQFLAWREATPTDAFRMESRLLLLRDLSDGAS